MNASADSQCAGRSAQERARFFAKTPVGAAWERASDDLLRLPSTQRDAQRVSDRQSRTRASVARGRRSLDALDVALGNFYRLLIDRSVGYATQREPLVNGERRPARRDRTLQGWKEFAGALVLSHGELAPEACNVISKISPVFLLLVAPLQPHDGKVLLRGSLSNRSPADVGEMLLQHFLELRGRGHDGPRGRLGPCALSTPMPAHLADSQRFWNPADQRVIEQVPCKIAIRPQSFGQGADIGLPAKRTHFSCGGDTQQYRPVAGKRQRGGLSQRRRRCPIGEHSQFGDKGPQLIANGARKRHRSMRPIRCDALVLQHGNALHHIEVGERQFAERVDRSVTRARNEAVGEVPCPCR